MGKLRGTILNQTKLQLKAIHRFSDPKKITQVAANTTSLIVQCITNPLSWKVKSGLGLLRKNLTL
jgi:hypothetical protein